MVFYGDLMKYIVFPQKHNDQPAWVFSLSVFLRLFSSFLNNEYIKFFPMHMAIAVS